jgi:hypothetical protein
VNVLLSNRHLIFNILLILLPWSSLLFIEKHTVKRYSLAGVVIVIVEALHQIVGQKRKWWFFYDKPKSYLKDMVPFSLGPYFPMSVWMLKLAYGNFKKFLSLNAIANGFFAFPFINVLKKTKIANLYRLTKFQFFIYLFSKALLLYGVQYFVENRRGQR